MAETGGVCFRVPVICSARAIMSWVRMTRSSSLLWRWRGVLLVSALALAPVGLAFGVLVFGWASELDGVALVLAGFLKDVAGFEV